jgi:GntR family transcriptional regulator, arabinose operon transcriptional repressor
MLPQSNQTPKHLQVYSALLSDIHSGRWKQGDRLPSEAELVEAFGVSRITVGRALRDLRLAGLIERRAGSGTFLRGHRQAGARSFGLLIPSLGETEIFEPICQGMMASPLARQHALLWGCDSAAANSNEERAWHLCRQYIERHVSGVFFAPLELTPTKDDWNERIGRAFDAARIPVILLDRPLLPEPAPPRYDLVGIDNRQAGRIVADHLLSLGCRRLAFIALKHAASTVNEREAGYREALFSRSLPVDGELACRIDPEDSTAVEQFMSSCRPDGIVCANDRTAGRLMHTLLRLKYRVPQDVKLVGIDDAEYASLLPVPLTTLRQPTRAIGETALALMLERIGRPEMPLRDTRLHCDLIVRESCGAVARDS